MVIGMAFLSSMTFTHLNKSVDDGADKMAIVLNLTADQASSFGRVIHDFKNKLEPK